MVTCPRDLPRPQQSREGAPCSVAIGADATQAMAKGVMPKQSQCRWVSHHFGQLLKQNTGPTSLGQHCDKSGYFKVQVGFLKPLCPLAQVLLILSRAPCYIADAPWCQPGRIPGLVAP